MTKVTVLDGSFSTQVSKHVGKSADGDPLWTARFLVTNPDSILAAHLDFLRAGSDIIETNTYQASVDGFSKYLGMNESDSIDLIHKAVDLAAQAVKIYKDEIHNNENVVNRNPLIAGSCGPYGATLHDASEYSGLYGKTVSKDFLKDWHRPRIEALIKAGVDLIALETIPCAEEAEVLVELMSEFPKTNAWLSLSCANDDTGTLVDGSNFKQVALKCWSNALPHQLIAIGLNCISPHHVSSYLATIHECPEGKNVPLIVYANSGEIYTSDAGWKKGDDRSKVIIDNEKYIHEWLNQGVQFIGGCCRVDALDIAKIRKQVETWRLQERETAV